MVHRFFPNICFMSTGIIVSKIWSMSHNFKDTSTDESLKVEKRNDSTILLTNADNPKQELYMCNLCGKEYTWLYSLRRHQLQCGNKETKIKCEFCLKKFYRRDRLKEHLNVHHSSLPLSMKIMKK